MYAYFKRLDYFSTECLYAPFAARGYARDFVKDLEVRACTCCLLTPPFVLTVARRHCSSGVWRALGLAWLQARPGTAPPLAHKSCCAALRCVRNPNPLVPCCAQAARPSAILDLIRSAESYRFPTAQHSAAAGSAPQPHCAQRGAAAGEATPAAGATTAGSSSCAGPGPAEGAAPGVAAAQGGGRGGGGRGGKAGPAAPRQCERCGYISSQPVCKSCVLLEGLNRWGRRAHPRVRVRFWVLCAPHPAVCGRRHCAAADGAAVATAVAAGAGQAARHPCYQAWAQTSGRPKALHGSPQHQQSPPLPPPPSAPPQPPPSPSSPLLVLAQAVRPSLRVEACTTSKASSSSNTSRVRPGLMLHLRRVRRRGPMGQRVAVRLRVACTHRGQGGRLMLHWKL